MTSPASRTHLPRRVERVTTTAVSSTLRLARETVSSVCVLEEPPPQRSGGSPDQASLAHPVDQADEGPDQPRLAHAAIDRRRDLRPAARHRQAPDLLPVALKTPPGEVDAGDLRRADAPPGKGLGLRQASENLEVDHRAEALLAGAAVVVGLGSPADVHALERDRRLGDELDFLAPRER